MSDLLKQNLNNIQVQQYDLFGNKVEKLSMRDRIGFLPLSIWDTDWEIVKKLKEIVGDKGESREDCAENAPSNVRGGGGDQYPKVASIFNPHLAQMILSAYCPPAANIYDPFAGGGTRGFIASAMGHNYTGRELRQQEVDRILSKQQELDKYFTIECGDAQCDPPATNHYDFSYTCPPYFNLEVYSDLDNDLSNCKSYNTFLTMIGKSMSNVYKSLRNNTLSVWVVGNFRDNKGNLTHFSGDLVKVGLNNGFVLHDEIIFWGASKSAAQRVCNFEANRKSVRVHENIIIFKKE